MVIPMRGQAMQTKLALSLQHIGNICSNGTALNGVGLMRHFGKGAKT
jgi:hypothetical protein